MKTKAQAGFTLTEVMVAVFILSIFIIGCYTAVTGALWMNQSARDHYVAVQLANSRLERARNIQYASLSQMIENNVVMDANGVPNANGSFRRTTTVNANYGSNLTEFVIQVDIRNRKTGQFGSVNETLASVLPSTP
jgi:prepilin-type N-terminal cleavage/methylation domain-containing protein